MPARPGPPRLHDASPVLKRADAIQALLVAALALAVRLLFLFSSPDFAWPHSIWYEGDAPQWVAYAAALNTGQPYEFNLPIHSPAVAYLMHWLSPHAVSPPFTAFKALWCLLSAAACGVAHLCFIPTIGRRSAVIASGLCIFSFGLSILATSLNNETPYLLALVAAILLSLRFRNCSRSRNALFLALAIGFLHGLATLIRPEHTLLLLIMLPWLLVRPKPSPTLPPLRFAHRVLGVAIILIASILACLPWTLHAIRATREFNQTALTTPDFNRIRPPWTDDGRAFIASLPPYAQTDNAQYITAIAAGRGLASIDAAFARQLLLDDFGVLPEPLPGFTFVSSQGPLSFALANHPDAHGRFSKAALIDPRFGNDPKLNLAMPSHAHLYNHGYAVGLDFIRRDPAAWLGAVREKLAIFSDGIALGFTARNLPEGLTCIRRPVDLATSAPDPANPLAAGLHFTWHLTVLGLLAAGIIITFIRRSDPVWLLVILYKAIIVIAFYGYARQAVSILPAFFAVIALGIDPLAAAIQSRARLTASAGRSITVAILLVMFSIELLSASQRQRLVSSGTVKDAPQWGKGAFESFSQIEIRPAP